MAMRIAVAAGARIHREQACANDDNSKDKLEETTALLLFRRRGHATLRLDIIVYLHSCFFLSSLI